jgi:hypothetical protein
MTIAPHFKDTPEYWHKRADEARVLAEEHTDEMAKNGDAQVAEGCDKLAKAVPVWTRLR